MNDSEVASGVRFQVAKDFLHRAGFKEVEKKEVNENRSIKIEFNIPRPLKETGVKEFQIQNQL